MTVSSRNVVWDDPVVSDDIGTELKPSCDPASGSRDFPEEIPTVVTCTVRDDAMNAASCSFVIVVGRRVSNVLFSFFLFAHPI